MAPSRTVLLKSSEVAALLGLSVSTVKRVADLGQLPVARTSRGKHRLFDPEAVLHYARVQGLPTAPIEAVVAERSGRVTPQPVRGLETSHRVVEPERVDQFERALRRGRQDEAKAVAVRTYEECGGALPLGDELVRPAMERLGDAWSVDELDVFQEHRATRMVEHLLIDLNWRIQQLNSRRTGTRPLAIGASPEDDPYTLPGLLCEMVLREQGWDVMNLGPNLPLKSLGRAVDAHHPRLLWLSVSHLEDPGTFVADYGRFYAAAVRHDVAVILGGKALVPALRPQLRCSAFGERLSHLAEFARFVAPRGTTNADPTTSD